MALTLELVSLCEQLGLTSAASYWVATAAPDAPLAPQRLQLTLEQAGVHKLVQSCLLTAPGRPGSPSSRARKSSTSYVSTATRLASAAGSEGTMKGSRSRPVSVPTAAAVGAARLREAGLDRSVEMPQLPVHASFMLDAMQMVPTDVLETWRAKGCSSSSSGGVSSSPEKQLVRVPWLQPMRDVHGWLMRARYLTSRGMAAAAQELLEVVVEYAR